jgi:hypothetical protein
LASVLVITNPVNEDVSKYYVKGPEKDIPKDLMSLLEGTTIGQDFADITVQGRTDIEDLYLIETTTLKNVLPERTDVTAKLDAIEEITKK